jgi:hypothetical protein
MTAQGPRKGESSSCSMRNGFRTQPARLVRGSSRRIMSMRFRPANIRVINRRVCSSAVIGPAVPNKTSSRPTSRNVFAPEPPSNVSPLPERCSQSRVRFAAPNSGAPLTAALRSGPLLLRRAAPAGTLHEPAPNPKPKAGFPPAEASRPKNQNPSKYGGLDRSLHIRTPAFILCVACMQGMVDRFRSPVTLV